MTRKDEAIKKTADVVLNWEKITVPPGHRWPVYGGVIWSTPIREGSGRIIVGQSLATKQWHVGGWRPNHQPRVADFPGNEFSTAAKAKRFVQDLARAQNPALEVVT